VVLQANRLIWWLYRELRPLLSDGWGGLNGPGLLAGLEMLQVPVKIRGFIVRQIGRLFERPRSKAHGG